MFSFVAPRTKRSSIVRYGNRASNNVSRSFNEKLNLCVRENDEHFEQLIWDFSDSFNICLLRIKVLLIWLLLFFQWLLLFFPFDICIFCKQNCCHTILVSHYWLICQNEIAVLLANFIIKSECFAYKKNIH